MSGACFGLWERGLFLIELGAEQRSNCIFFKGKRHTPDSNCRRKICKCQAHRRPPGEGDLAIVEPRARSNAAIAYFSKAKKESGRDIP